MHAPSRLTFGLHISGVSFRCRLLSPAPFQGESFTLNRYPLFGSSKCGDSSTVIKPFQSVAGSLPSTGLVKSKRMSRSGM